MTDWTAHVAVSAVIHGLIYGLIFKVMHQLTLAQTAVLVVAVLAVIFMWGRGARSALPVVCPSDR